MERKRLIARFLRAVNLAGLLAIPLALLTGNRTLGLVVGSLVLVSMVPLYVLTLLENHRCKASRA